MYIVSCTKGRPQWYRVAKSGQWCQEKWETKKTSRWTGNGSPARVSTTWSECPINTTSALAPWDGEWVRSSLSLGISSQVHWIDRNISQVSFVLQDIAQLKIWTTSDDWSSYVTSVFHRLYYREFLSSSRTNCSAVSQWPCPILLCKKLGIFML